MLGRGFRLDYFWIHEGESDFIFLGVDFLIMVLEIDVVGEVVGSNKTVDEVFVYGEH